MKIGIIYSEKDWTAADIALKIQAIAFSKDIDCFISPKHTVRNDDKVLLSLRKCSHILFLSHDIKNPDEITVKELNYLKDKPIIAIVKKPFKKLENITFKNIIEYETSKNAIEYLKKLIDNVSKNQKSIKIKKEENNVLLLGLTALLLLLLVGSTNNKK